MFICSGWLVGACLKVTGAARHEVGWQLVGFSFCMMLSLIKFITDVL